MPTPNLVCIYILPLNTKITIVNKGKINIGKAYFFDNCSLSAVNGILTIGSNVFFNRNNIIVCHCNITIADNCRFGPNVAIYDHNHKFDKSKVYGSEFSTGSIVIENGCWIGAGCIILRNTHIGEGSVIGAGCIVKGNIPPHSLVTSSRELEIIPIGKE